MIFQEKNLGCALAILCSLVKNNTLITKANKKFHGFISLFLFCFLPHLKKKLVKYMVNELNSKITRDRPVTVRPYRSQSSSALLEILDRKKPVLFAFRIKLLTFLKVCALQNAFPYEDSMTA